MMQFYVPIRLTAIGVGIIFLNLIKNAVEEINHNEIQSSELLIIIKNGKRNVSFV